MRGQQLAKQTACRPVAGILEVANQHVDRKIIAPGAASGGERLRLLLTGGTQPLAMGHRQGAACTTVQQPGQIQLTSATNRLHLAANRRKAQQAVVCLPQPAVNLFNTGKLTGHISSLNIAAVFAV